MAAVTGRRRLDGYYDDDDATDARWHARISARYGVNEARRMSVAALYDTDTIRVDLMDVDNDVCRCTCITCDATVDVVGVAAVRDWTHSHRCPAPPVEPAEWDDTLDGQAEVQQRPWERSLNGHRGWTA